MWNQGGFFSPHTLLLSIPERQSRQNQLADFLSHPDVQLQGKALQMCGLGRRKEGTTFGSGPLVVWTERCCSLCYCKSIRTKALVRPSIQLVYYPCSFCTQMWKGMKKLLFSCKGQWVVTSSVSSWCFFSTTLWDLSS